MVLVEKLNFFHFLIFGKIGRKKAFGVIVERKKPLQTLKRRAKKKIVQFRFSKGLVHGFSPKMGFFPPFHLSQNRQETSLWRYSRKKKRLYRQ